MTSLAKASLVDLIERHENDLGLVNLECRDSLGGWQAIAKYREHVGGPWGVGCDTNMVVAMTKALLAGEHELALDRGWRGTEWTPSLDDTTPSAALNDLLDDI
jgi:hypothetical protein